MVLSSPSKLGFQNSIELQESLMSRERFVVPIDTPVLPSVLASSCGPIDVCGCPVSRQARCWRFQPGMISKEMVQMRRSAGSISAWQILKTVL